MKIMNDDERKKLILNYVINHQGCTREEIDKHKDEVPISRQKLFDLIKEMINEGSLREELKRRNSRDHKLYPVHDNIFFTVPRELDGVKEAYKGMLQLFTDKVSSICPSPNMKTYSANLTIIDPLIGEISGELDHFLRQRSKDRNLHKNALILFEKIEHRINNSLTRYMELKSDHTNDLYLFQAIATDTFYFISDCYFHRSLLSWRTKIVDKDGMDRLNTILFATISEMHIQLIEFLNRVKAVTGITMINVFSHRSFLHPLTMENDFGHYIMKYGPEPKIEKVLETLVMACAELKSFDYSLFSRKEVESIVEADKKILRLQKEIVRTKNHLVHKNNAQHMLNAIVSLKTKCKSMS